MTIFGPALDVRPLFPRERQALLELLGRLAPEDWSRPTVCPGWDVHDVVAHVLNDYMRRLSGSRDGYFRAVFADDETLPAYLLPRARQRRVREGAAAGARRRLRSGSRRPRADGAGAGPVRAGSAVHPACRGAPGGDGGRAGGDRAGRRPVARRPAGRPVEDVPRRSGARRPRLDGPGHLLAPGHQGRHPRAGPRARRHVGRRCARLGGDHAARDRRLRVSGDGTCPGIRGTLARDGAQARSG
ncbi:hypothetical protein FE391_21480 [Nonomuraea sp. KC401]|uniref:maleylpyruvate isomerase N-terminal domain-containing protein n=1 Tax=unclassified Nonomuraea TaxID=2593643 RepID=UPI0010FF4A76|nr:hypothetical protein [Nonomuraea sp. K271]TLF68665.1 hypothetical protein FE391_21480 [Nonomuraea sp. KC401]